MRDILLKKVCPCFVILILVITTLFTNINVLKVEATIVDANAFCSGTSSVHTLNSSISNVCGSMGSSTYGYVVGNTTEWICVSPNMSSPIRQYGRVDSISNTNMFNGGNYSCLAPLENLTVSQAVFGCCSIRNSNWGMAHAVLSYVVNGDTTWLSKIVNGGMAMAVRQFAADAARAGRAVSSNHVYYLFTPNNPYSYQRLVNTEFVPTEGGNSANISFNKTDSNGAPVSGAIIQITGTTEASVNELAFNVEVTRITNGYQFTTNGSTVRIEGLKANNTYRLHEVSAPSGYALAEDITVSVDSNFRVTSSLGTGSSVNMVDNNVRVGSVVFHKKAESANGNNLQGAVITFTAATDNTVPDPMGSITYTAGSGVNASFDGTTVRFTTADVNDQITITGLKPNARYVFHEESAPSGYIPDLDQIVVVAADGSVSNGGSVTFVDSVDTNHYGSMRFFKNFEDIAGELIDTVNIFVYQEGYNAPFVQMESTRRFRMNGDNSFWFGNDRLSLCHLSDTSHFGVQAPVGIIDRVDENGDHWYSVDPAHDGNTWDANGWAYTVTGLPESMYIVEEDWIVASFNSLSSSERVAIEGMNCDGWTRLPSYVDDQGNYHVRFRAQVLIAYTGNGDSGLNHSVYNPEVGFLNSYGAMQVTNSEATVPFDVTKIQHGRDVSELSFQLWTMNGSTPSNHIANGSITTSATAPDTYSVSWNYTLHQFVITGHNAAGYEGSWQDLEYTNANTINHLPLGRYQLREYATNIGAYAVPEGWERITDSTGTYFATVIDLTNVQVGYNNHPMQMVTVENKSGMIRVLKTDLWTGLPITNYQGTLSFDLYDLNNNRLGSGTDSNRDGIVEFDLFEIFPNGNFPSELYLVETSCPVGYYLYEGHIPVTVEDGYAEVTVEDAPYTAQLTIHKLDSDTNEVINFVEFTVYEDTNADGIHQANEPVASSFVNDTLVQARVEFNGTDYVTTPLRSGHYIIVETGLPEGYFYCDANGEPTATPNSYAFEVENRDTTAPNFVVASYETTMYNAEVDIQTNLLVTETGSNVAPLADFVELTDIVTYENLIVGEEFVLEGILMNKETGEPILDENGNPVTGRTVFIPETSDGTVEVSFTINTNFLFDGSNPIDVVCFETLKYGERIVKIHADINDDNQTIHIVKLFNIELTKLGEQFVSVELIDGRYVPVWETRTLSDATFAIYAAEDIVTPDGVVRHVAGELIETITTDENGYAISSNLFLGAYRVVEIEAPIDYALGYDEIIVGEDRGDIALYTISATDCIDLPFTPSLSVYKTLMPGQVNGSNNGAWYVGDFGCVTFGIYANEDIYAPDGTSIPKDGLIEVISCNSRGQATSSVNFPYGSYYVRELTTDMWHYTDNNSYEFS
ncbi:MAG: VaFE repeat-containing surface-anchored protein, partial [Saccharofermentans sp.]|nr:VaFE repeat-containing surface-anchored protein [Saccharofermentans sp.]